MNIFTILISMFLILSAIGLWFTYEIHLQNKKHKQMKDELNLLNKGK